MLSLDIKIKGGYYKTLKATSIACYQQTPEGMTIRLQGTTKFYPNYTMKPITIRKLKLLNKNI